MVNSKRLLSITLVLIIILGTFIGCSKSTESNNSQEESKEVNLSQNESKEVESEVQNETEEEVSEKHLVIATSEGIDMSAEQKILTEAYKRIGYSVEFKLFPVERSIQVANSGEADGEIMREEGIEKDYPNMIMVPVILKSDSIVVVTKNKKFKVNGWESLLPYSVGYIRGVKLVEMNLVEGTYSEANDTGEQLYQKLENGRIDVVVDAPVHANERISKLGLEDDLTILDPPIFSITFYHFLNKKNKNLLGPLTKAMQEMEDEGFMLN